MGYVPNSLTSLETELWVHLPEEYSDVASKPVRAEVVQMPFRESVTPNQREILRNKGLDAAA